MGLGIGIGTQLRVRDRDRDTGLGIGIVRRSPTYSPELTKKRACGEMSTWLRVRVRVRVRMHTLKHLNGGRQEQE